MHNPEPGQPAALGPYLHHMVAGAVAEHFPEDICWVQGSIIFLPSDVAISPVGVIYIQIDGTEDVDGLYLIDMIAASLINQELVDKTVEDLAIKSAERRGEIRNSLAQGTGRSVGLPKDDDDS